MGRKAFVRDRILEAAFDLVARRGYEAVSSREVAKAAGVGPTSMYRHFRSMEDLGRTLYGIALAPLAAAVEDLIDGSSSPRVLLKGLVPLFYGFYDTRPRALALLVFPPHDFTPHELSVDNPHAIRNRLRDALQLDEDDMALVWGALLGPIHDRYLHRGDGSMGPLAADHACRITRLLPTNGSST